LETTVFRVSRILLTVQFHQLMARVGMVSVSRPKPRPGLNFSKSSDRIDSTGRLKTAT